MIGERENIYSDTNYGTLVMRSYNIEGNEINAFYDSSDNLVFVLDNTINAQKPNVLLVINPVAGKKWDEILSGDYDVDLETVRPKQDNKYQKLDIEYSGLNVYENLINAYNSGEGLEEDLVQLNILRDSAVRHSAMTRLNVANEIISKTNATIVKTKEAIVRLQTRIKTLRAKLSETKKEIGKVPTKKSASVVLKIESQIEATNEKLKRAQKRLESAQHRLEIATVDAELANSLLNQPSSEIKHTAKTKPVMVAPKYEVQTVENDDVDEEDIDDFDEDEEDGADKGYDDIYEESDEIENNDEVKPLFNEEPQIINENIAFKPIAFDAPATLTEDKPIPEIPVLNQDMFARHLEVPNEERLEEKPVLETMAPIMPVPESFKEYLTEDVQEKPVLETMTPIVNTQQNEIKEIEEPKMEVEPVVDSAPVDKMLNYVPVRPPVIQQPVYENESTQTSGGKPNFVYYLLLFVLIVLSVFTLWLYQKNVHNTTPVLTAKTQETEEVIVESSEVQPAVVSETKDIQTEDDYYEVFLGLDSDVGVEIVSEESETAPEEQPVDDSEEMESVEEVEEVAEDVAPVIMDVVPARVTTSGYEEISEKDVLPSEEDILASKPVYEPGQKYDEMFVNEQDGVAIDDSAYYDYPEYYDDEDMFFDEEEAAYQAEQEMYYEE